MIYHPDPNKPFKLFCDASGKGVGAVLTQVHDGQLRPIQFSSKLFNKTQQNWHVSEQEICAVIHAVEKWRQYLIGNAFTVYTDHYNLQELFNRAKNFKAGKLYRWAVRLQEFEFTAKYIKGEKNIMADYLSRDALTSIHAATPTLIRPKTQNIYGLYMNYLAFSSHPSEHMLYPIKITKMDPMETTSDSEDEDIEINYKPKIRTKPNKRTNKTTNKSIRTRLQVKRAKDQQYQSTLNEPLTIINDPNYNTPINNPENKTSFYRCQVNWRL